MPGSTDPDEVYVRELVKRESSDNSTLDDLAVPLVVLITRLCGSDANSRTRMREWILPANLDRTSPLEGREDLLGRSLRLLGSVYHPRMKDAVGEMLFVICNSDGKFLCFFVFTLNDARKLIEMFQPPYFPPRWAMVTWLDSCITRVS
jgi:hypothetical protein